MAGFPPATVSQRGLPLPHRVNTALIPIRLLSSCGRLRIARDMAQPKKEERAVLLAREAVELADAGQREVLPAQTFLSVRSGDEVDVNGHCFL